MKLKIDLEVNPSQQKISHKCNSIFMGSCFSDEIAKKFHEGGLNVISNPFGTLFHPIAIANLFDEVDIDSSCFQRRDLWFSWLASGIFFATSKGDLVKKIENTKKELMQSVKQADFLFFTFGTAIGYRLKSTGQIVANCHKFPQYQFEKELTSINELRDVWSKVIRKIKFLNPNIKLVFTVSPVRHIKEGIIENNISKSHLFSLINQLNVSYFPSYEIINDELRDYRFFKEDLVHPNELAINYVWNRFKETYMDASTNSLIDEVLQVRRMLNHKILYPDTLESLKFNNQLFKKKEDINKIIPHIKW